MTQLTDLDLRGTKVTDEGLKSLAALTKLQTLHLNDLTGVTDKGLGHLGGLKALTRLDLRGTKVTDGGKADLKKALPTVKFD
jgi:internalin A